MRRVSIVAVLAAIALAAVAGLRAAHSDEDVGRFLLKEAKKAISLHHYDEAVVKLRRVEKEAPELLEATYLLGKVFEKQKDPGQALGAYRRFRDGCRARGKDLERSDRRLLRLALRRIAVLGKHEQELDDLQLVFAKKMTDFARRMQDDDRDIAIDALHRLLAVVPDDKGAHTLLAKLTGSPDPLASGEEVQPGDVPVPGIHKWRDMLAERSIPPGAKVQYKHKGMTLDEKGGSIFWTDPVVLAPQTFVYEVEFRFLKEYSPGCLVGLVFARDEKMHGAGRLEFVSAVAEETRVSIFQGSGGKNIDVAGADVAPPEPKTWRRLLVAVEGRKVSAYVDGKRVLHSSVPGRKTLGGGVGFFHQRCVAEIRVLRLGTKE